jgi:hypothetical protein
VSSNPSSTKKKKKKEYLSWFQKTGPHIYDQTKAKLYKIWTLLNKHPSYILGKLKSKGKLTMPSV